MLAFAQVPWVVARSLKVLEGIRSLSRGQGRSAQRSMSVNVLGRHQSFATLPGGEASLTEEFQRCLPSAALVQQRNQLHGQIVPARHKPFVLRSEEHTSELQSLRHLV